MCVGGCMGVGGWLDGLGMKRNRPGRLFTLARGSDRLDRRSCDKGQKRVFGQPRFFGPGL